MAKYLEQPTKPATILAVQFTGIEDDVPRFDEPVPTWVLSNLVRGHLSMVNGVFYHNEAAIPVGAWLFVQEGDTTGDGLRVMAPTQFIARYRPFRRKAVRKPKSAKPTAVAAE